MIDRAWPHRLDEHVAIPLRDSAGVIRAHAIVDSEDAHFADVRWCRHSAGYAARSVGGRHNRRQVYLHREIAQPGIDCYVDHINGDRLDNRRANLRVVTKAENGQNTRARGGTSPYRGVFFDRNGKGAWRAQARVNGRVYTLGPFATDDEADAAVSAFRRKHLPYTNEDRRRIDSTPQSVERTADDTRT